MKLSEYLKEVLADAVSMKLAIHGFHWNVEGPNFQQYHSLFGDIYNDIESSIDPLAENIRKLGEYAPFTLTRMIELRSVKDPVNVTPKPEKLVAEALKMNDQILKCIATAFALATKENQQGVANFLAERQDMHLKWKWQLTASSK
jgi:starvation-inducible DNA-binding protein